MAANAQHGSFYLQSKVRAPAAPCAALAVARACADDFSSPPQVHRSMERIGQEMGKDTSGMGGAGPAGGAEGGSTPPEEGAAPPGGQAGPGSVNASAAAAHASDAPRWGGFAASGVGTHARH
jgi:hypothetical protein